MNLHVENASFRYNKNIPLLEHVSFEVVSGEVLAILGPNGTGKTTLLRCLTRSLKWQNGRTILDGTDVREIPTRTFWQRVSYVPQARGIASGMSVENMILLGCTGRLNYFSNPGEKEIKLVHTLAERLHIEKLLKAKCSQISGGELQMVLIARALAAEPELIILDEPESNLDFKNQLIVLNTISELASEGMCCVFNTHYPDHAFSRAAKSLILHKGSEPIFGDTATVLTTENIERTFGVRTIIGEIETDGLIYRSILPIEIINDPSATSKDDNRHCIATVSLILTDRKLGPRVEEIFSKYSEFIIGRMGIPYPDAGVHLITVTLDAPYQFINTLVGLFSVLPGIKVKAVIAEKR